MPVVLIGLRYGAELREECDSFDEAMSTALGWLDADDETSVGASYAVPVRVEDAAGQVLTTF